MDINGQFHAIDHELNADTQNHKLLGVGIFTYSVKGNEVITHSYSYHEKEGRVIQMVVRGEEDAVMNVLQEHHPLFTDILPVTFEEMFLYELEQRSDRS